MWDKLKNKWYVYFATIVLGAEAIVFLIFRENSYIQVHDNLDLFVAHYQMMRLNGGFFAHNATMPMLHGINRDLLGSELLLYNIMYILLPGIWAYFAGYALKIAIGMVSFQLLAKDILAERYEDRKAIVMLVSLAYGLIPVFPAYGIAFTSIPLIVWLVRKVYAGGSKWWYLAIFLYPTLSYFSYHGFFILAYLCLALVILWIRDKRFPIRILAAICTLSAGYVLLEYRLFKAMLLDDTVTIRSSIDHGSLSITESLKEAFREFINPSFHSEDSHTYLVLWVVLIGWILINYYYVKNGRADAYKSIIGEPVNIVMLAIIFNCLVFGFYGYAPFRGLIEKIVNKLEGFDFSRTSFLNPFLWYVELLLVLDRLISSKGKWRTQIAGGLAAISVLVSLLVPQLYNDFYNTCYNQAYRIIKHKETSTLNYREFYSTELFDKIKSDIGYDGEWAAAYGMHPAVLQYNGIATVDGYLGMYSQEYKDLWTAIEEPAFRGSPSHKDYFENWGARVCLYSGSDENTYAPLRELKLNDNRLMVDVEKLELLGTKYIFSRIPIGNDAELGIKLVGTYTDESSPYRMYLYNM